MPQHKFFLGMVVSDVIGKSRTQTGPARMTLHRHPEIIPGKLLSSRARVRFISDFQCKSTLGLILKCKSMQGL